MVDGRFFDWIAWLGLLVQLMMIFLFVPLVMGVAGLFQNDAELAYIALETILSIYMLGFLFSEALKDEWWPGIVGTSLIILILMIYLGLSLWPLLKELYV